MGAEKEGRSKGRRLVECYGRKEEERKRVDRGHRNNRKRWREREGEFCSGSSLREGRKKKRRKMESKAGICQWQRRRRRRRKRKKRRRKQERKRKKKEAITKKMAMSRHG